MTCRMYEGGTLLNKYHTADNDHDIPAGIPEQIRRADRQILMNESDTKYLERMIRELISENEHMTGCLNEKDETECILRYLLNHRYRHDLTNRCAELILKGRYTISDLLRIFGHSIYAEAADLLDRAYSRHSSITETDTLSCPDPEDNVLTDDPEVHRLFSEYEQIMYFLDRKAEKQEVLRYLIRSRYRNELICLCTEYMLVEGLQVNDLKGMFGPDICSEAFILLQDLRDQWLTET